MKIYGLITNFGTEYDAFSPAELSLKPYDHDCYVLELSDNSSKSFSYLNPIGLLIIAK